MTGRYGWQVFIEFDKSCKAGFVRDYQRISIRIGFSSLTFSFRRDSRVVIYFHDPKVALVVI